MKNFKTWFFESLGYDISGPKEVQYTDMLEVSWTFTPDNYNHYHIFFEQVNNTIWEMSMVRNGGFEKKVQANPIKVINTRKRILEEFIKTYKPSKIISKPIDHETGRLWYKTFVRWGYKPRVYTEDGLDVIEINV